MCWFLYNTVLILAGIFMMPHFILKMKRRGGYRENFGNRFGRFSASQLADFAKGRSILIHAASVGEVGVAFQFIESFREENPGQRFVVSVTSSTGWQEAERRLTPLDSLIYCPLDLGGFVRRTLDAVKPLAFVMVETEIWPNLIRACAARGVPMAIVNGRISDKSAPSYRRFRFLFGPVLRMVRLLAVQSELDASRFIAAGADPATVKVLGSFKFDVARRNPAKEEMWRGLLAKLDLMPPRLLLLGASTWEGEEGLLLDAFLDLRRDFPELRLALVPRHFERREQVEAQIAARGLRPVRKTDLDSGAAPAAALSPDDILLGDTTGEVMGLYPFAAITVVGRTFFSRGGQNMIEPCLAGSATVVGPETQNFRPVMADLLAADALVQVPSREALTPALRGLVASPESRAALRERAAKAVEARRGTVGKTTAAFGECCLRQAPLFE